jgi:hypothetical protein
MKFIQSIGLMVLACIFAGCAATQPVKWTTCAPMDLTKGGKVAVTAGCEMPPADMAYLQGDIQQKVREVLSGDPDLPDAYKVEVTITKYDKGNAFARFMLIGLGQMYLYGTVEIQQGEPPVVIREGEFKKNYCVGGIMGGSATMQKDVLPKVGKAIADAIKKQQEE